jgi:hypothetical protein
MFLEADITIFFSRFHQSNFFHNPSLELSEASVTFLKSRPFLEKKLIARLQKNYLFYAVFGFFGPGITTNIFKNDF